MRRLVAIWMTVGVVGACLTCGSAVAAASGTQGKLSRREYRLLRESQAATKKGFVGGVPHWGAAGRACQLIGAATEFMQADRASCLNGVTDFKAWVDISLRAKQCAGDAIAAGATTTTDGLSPAVMDELACVNPAYQGVAHEVPKLYAGDVALREAGIMRGFSGKCLATLVPTQQQLFFEHLYAVAATRVAGDVGVLVKILAGTASLNAVSGAKIGADQTALQDARNGWIRAGVGYALSVCPHR